MDTDILEQFRALREDNQILRQEMRGDLARLDAKLDGQLAAINGRCAKRGRELAVLASREHERDRRIDRRISLGLLLIAALTLVLKFIV